MLLEEDAKTGEDAETCRPIPESETDDNVPSLISFTFGGLLPPGARGNPPVLHHPTSFHRCSLCPMIGVPVLGWTAPRPPSCTLPSTHPINIAYLFRSVISERIPYVYEECNSFAYG
jgi:hypothetical protein